MSAHVVAALASAALFSTPGLAQQNPKPVRPIGPITAVSRDSLASVAAAVQVSGGRVFVNDITAHRLLLFDSTLAKGVVVADSTGATANAYGDRAGTLLAFRGDSALLITPSSLSMLVLSPDRGIVRTMAMPSTGGSRNGLIGDIFGTPGFDAQGRLVHFFPTRGSGAGGLPPGARVEAPDSAIIARYDFATRRLDSAAYFRIPKDRVVVNPQGRAPFRRTTLLGDGGERVVFGSTAFPPLTIDDWAVTSDGSIAIVRGRDYHVDWLSPDGKWTSSPKMPFTWERVNDGQKQALIDSVTTFYQTLLDTLQVRMERMRDSAGGSGAMNCGRGGCVPGGGGPPPPIQKMTVLRADLADVPDYRPPFAQGTVRADADNNLWIRTSIRIDGRPVYDIVNRKGELTDRVQLPRYRAIAGFGPGIVYMAVKDSANVVHLERARIK